MSGGYVVTVTRPSDGMSLAEEATHLVDTLEEAKETVSATIRRGCTGTVSGSQWDRIGAMRLRDSALREARLRLGLVARDGAKRFGPFPDGSTITVEPAKDGGAA